ncbi:MAG: DnaD domain protein [Oscillospiraceae bacterium]|nr:DnaD domain protein [Oscillospiraceae bacterium]
MVNFSFGKVLEVPEIVASAYINECNELQLKTLLLLVLTCDATPLQIAGKLGATTSEVEQAVDFWMQKKVLVCEKEELRENKDKLFAIKLTPEEATHMIVESEELSFVLGQFPGILGRMQNQFDLINLVDLHFNLGMEPELIMFLLKYCATIGQISAKAIRREANFWFESGINSYEAAEVYAARNVELESWHETVREKLQLPTLNNKQKLIIKKWQTDLKLNLETIEKAINVALEQKGEVNVPYINGILVNWVRKTPRHAGIKKGAVCGSGKKTNKLLSFKIEDMRF